MSKHMNWNNAVSELESARTMFNYAETQFHIDVAIQAMAIAEEKLAMLRDLSKINYIPPKQASTQEETLLQKVVRKGREVLLHAK